jgi:hypothetical protein
LKFGCALTRWVIKLNFRICCALTKIARATTFQYLENSECSLSGQTWQLKSVVFVFRCQGVSFY